jgi:hypothetical protein
MSLFEKFGASPRVIERARQYYEELLREGYGLGHGHPRPRSRFARAGDYGHERLTGGGSQSSPGLCSERSRSEYTNQALVFLLSSIEAGRSNKRKDNK